MQTNWERLFFPEFKSLNRIYNQYCQYRNFKSVMPIFDSEYTNPDNEVIGYYDQGDLVAFSLIRVYDIKNVEAVQFAWNYENPLLSLGIRSLEHECALYRDRGFEYFYIGADAPYKQKFQGYERLGPANEE